MRPHRIVSTLLDGDWNLNEVTLRRPPRSSRWVATFTGPEPSQQISRSTGLQDREAALALARRWEEEARRQRLQRLTKDPPAALGAARAPGLTQAEVAAVLGLSQRAVRTIEKRALRKLRRHPALRALWAQWESVAAPRQLDWAEVDALFALVATPLERRALIQALITIWMSGD